MPCVCRRKPAQSCRPVSRSCTFVNPRPPKKKRLNRYRNTLKKERLNRYYDPITPLSCTFARSNFGSSLRRPKAALFSRSVQQRPQAGSNSSPCSAVYSAAKTAQAATARKIRNQKAAATSYCGCCLLVPSLVSCGRYDRQQKAAAWRQARQAWQARNPLRTKKRKYSSMGVIARLGRNARRAARTSAKGTRRTHVSCS